MRASINYTDVLVEQVTLVWTAQRFKIGVEMVIDSKNEFIYLTHNFGISKISTDTWHTTLITGKYNLGDEETVDEAVDGSFEEAVFKR